MAQDAPPIAALPEATRIASVALEVADLRRSVDFYTDVIGLEPIGQTLGHAALGVAGRTLLQLDELPGASSVVASSTGLYHLAILVGSRVELGRSLARLVERGYPLGGASDHLVSEALYLSDPDGNGIEIYRDRPRAEWRSPNGELRMDTLPLDLRALLDDALAIARPWSGLAGDATIGHIHLQVDDLAIARAFYVDVLGFDVMVDLSRMGAVFVSAGGYHHHIGLNTWHSRGASHRPSDAAGLMSFDVELGDKGALDKVESRLAAAGVPVDGGDGYLSVVDPAGITVVLSGGSSDRPRQ